MLNIIIDIKTFLIFKTTCALCYEVNIAQKRFCLIHNIVSKLGFVNFVLKTTTVCFLLNLTTLYEPTNIFFGTEVYFVTLQVRMVILLLRLFH